MPKSRAKQKGPDASAAVAADAVDSPARKSFSAGLEQFSPRLTSSRLEAQSAEAAEEPVRAAAPVYDPGADADLKIGRECRQQVDIAQKRFDWTAGDPAEAKKGAEAQWKITFRADFIANSTDGSKGSKTKAGTGARRNAKNIARGIFEVAAVNLAKARATAGLGDGSSWAHLDATLSGTKEAYEAGETGAKSKYYAKALGGKKGSEMATMLDADAEVVAGRATRTDGVLGEGKPQWMWVFADGSVIRVKPEGDAFKDVPMFAVEVQNGSGAGGQAGIAFKVDDAANPVPKGPGNMSNPYHRGNHGSQHGAFFDCLIDAGHRQAAPE